MLRWRSSDSRSHPRSSRPRLIGRRRNDRRSFRPQHEGDRSPRRRTGRDGSHDIGELHRPDCNKDDREHRHGRVGHCVDLACEQCPQPATGDDPERDSDDNPYNSRHRGLPRRRGGQLPADDSSPSSPLTTLQCLLPHRPIKGWQPVRARGASTTSQTLPTWVLSEARATVRLPWRASRWFWRRTTLS